MEHAQRIYETIVSHTQSNNPSEIRNNNEEEEGLVVSNSIAFHNSSINNNYKRRIFGGISVMSTQPRDFPIVDSLASHLEQRLLVCEAAVEDGSRVVVEEDVEDGKEGEMTTRTTTMVPKATTLDSDVLPPVPSVRVVRCYGVHPWFLHQADADFQQFTKGDTTTTTTTAATPVILPGSDTVSSSPPSSTTSLSSLQWLPYLRNQLLQTPSSCVGEIGLDSIHYDPNTGQPYSTIQHQIEAFEAQLHLAADIQRCVSIHAVKAWGPLMDCIRRVRTERTQRRKKERQRQRREGGGERTKEETSLVLPPKIYFHAFGGSLETVRQLSKLCSLDGTSSSSTKRGSGTTGTTGTGTKANDYNTETNLYFGFAPCVNFRSPRTPDLVRTVGLYRLVLESDLEDYGCMMGDLEKNVEFVANTLDVKLETVREVTYRNAMRLYGFRGEWWWW